MTADWHARKKEIVRQGMAAPRVDRTFHLYDSYLQKMEDTLAKQPWLAGDTYSLADIAMAPYVNRLAMLGMSEMWVGRRPLLTAWFERNKSRAEFPAGTARRLPSRSHQRPQDLRQPKLAGGEASAGGLTDRPTRSLVHPRVNFFMNKFRKLDFIDYNGSIGVPSALLNFVLSDQPLNDD